MKRIGYKFADDDKYSISALAKMRIPPLTVGLLLGFVLSFATSRFDEVLRNNVQVAFFIPFIVYMADAVGTQTQSIYARDLGRGNAKFSTYFVKESFLGIFLGTVFGIVSGTSVYLWLSSVLLGLSVGIAAALAIATAPIVALLLVSELLEIEHKDPAVGAGPIATVIQDTISVVIYGVVASLILL